MKKKALRESRFKDKRDVTLSLPSTYKQFFKFTYRTNLLLIFKTSLMLALFATPLLAALYARTRIITGLTESSDTENLAANIMGFQGWYSFVLLAAFLVFSLGATGALFVMKKHIFNEGVIFMRDFFFGIKKNGIGNLAITFFYFGILALLNYFINLFTFQSDIPYYPILLVTFVLISVLLYMMWVLSIMIRIIYTCPFRKLLKNSFLMVFAKLPINLLSLVTTAAPLIIVWAIGYAPVLYAFALAYVAILFGNSALVVALFNCYVFDELVNKKQFPEAYRKGLFDGGQENIVDEGFRHGS
jgi:hypothetical protein